MLLLEGHCPPTQDKTPHQPSQKSLADTGCEMLLLTGFLTLQTKCTSLSPSLQETGRTGPPWVWLVTSQLYVTAASPCGMEHVKFSMQTSSSICQYSDFTTGLDRCSGDTGHKIWTVASQPSQGSLNRLWESRTQSPGLIQEWAPSTESGVNP